MFKEYKQYLKDDLRIIKKELKSIFNIKLAYMIYYFILFAIIMFLISYPFFLTFSKSYYFSLLYIPLSFIIHFLIFINDIIANKIMNL